MKSNDQPKSGPNRETTIDNVTFIDNVNGNDKYVLVLFIIVIIILREESYLNTVARTYMMELGAEMLESIRDEMLPLAEKWLPILTFRSSLC